MIPLDIVDVIVRQNRRHPVIQKIAHLWQRHVQRLLLATKSLIFTTQRPMRICAVDITVGVDHLWLEPQPEGHAQ